MVVIPLRSSALLELFKLYNQKDNTHISPFYIEPILTPIVSLNSFISDSNKYINICNTCSMYYILKARN
jgi:hypothetical protein